MANNEEQTAAKGGLLPILLTIGGFFAFAIILAFFWNQQRAATAGIGGRPPAERAELLRELRAREQEELTSYGWIDREHGVVRLPVERAMELVLEEMNQGQAQN